MWTDAVELGVACFLGMKGADDDAIVARLESLGVATWLARRLVVWLPVAYGRALLKDMTFDDTYQAGGETLVLADDPVFVAARRRAARPTRAEMEAIALRSADVAAVNAYLNKMSERGEKGDLTTLRTALALTDPLPPMGQGDGGVPEPREAFTAMFEAHGLTTLPDGMEIDAFVFPRLSAERFTLQVDYGVRDPRLATGRLLESFGSLGPSWREAVADTVHKLERGSVHVLIATLADPSACEDQVQWEDWSHAGRPLRVCLGAQLRLYGDGAPPLGPLLDQLREALAEASLTPAIHALRIYTMRKGDQVFSDEVLLDGEPWEAGLSLCGRYPWPRVDGVWGTRLFALLDAR